MKIYKRIRQNAGLILLILMTPMMVQPVAGQSGATNEASENQMDSTIFLPLVSSGSNNIADNIIKSASQQDENNGHNRIHHHATEHQNRSRFAALGDEWPPQAKSMRDVVLNSTEDVRNKIAERRAKSQVALRDAEVQEALGERFAYIDTEELARKGNRGRTDVRNTYFSHTYNQTIEVTVEQNQVTDIQVRDAAEYQPPLAPEEVEEAVNIARVYFEQQGVSRVAELEGFTILTFPGQGEGNFYTNRIGYVSFSPDADTNPEYVAWVDLTDQAVVESREE